MADWLALLSISWLSASGQHLGHYWNRTIFSGPLRFSNFKFHFWRQPFLDVSSISALFVCDPYFRHSTSGSMFFSLRYPYWHRHSPATLSPSWNCDQLLTFPLREGSVSTSVCGLIRISSLWIRANPVVMDVDCCMVSLISYFGCLHYAQNNMGGKVPSLQLLKSCRCSWNLDDRTSWDAVE